MIAVELAKYAHGLRFGALPKDVVSKAKTCVLDILAVSVGGYGSANARVALKGAQALGARGKARVWMTGEALRAVDAVLPNSVASHCILQDDWLQVSHSHIGAAVVPTTLAMGEEHGRGGKDVIAAIVAAYDVEDRAGTLSVPAFTRGYRVSSVYSYFGATTAAARMLGLTRPQFEAALGCAGSMCGGVLQPWIDGSMEWSFQEAFGSRAGILAVNLAANGLVGAKQIFEGTHGVNKSFSGTNEGQEEALRDLGSHFHIMDTCFKRYATGGANQGSAAVARALHDRHHPDVAKIKRVRVGIPRTGSHERMNYAGISYQGPFLTIDQCLISKPFAIAAVLIAGNMSIDTVRRLQKKPELFALTQRIELTEVEGINGWALDMAIDMEDGTTLTGSGKDIDLRHLYLSWDLACDKFRELAAPDLGAARAEEVIDLVGRLEKLDSVTPITQRLSPQKKPAGKAKSKAKRR
ncbi:MAG: MmgE/PrpD family protein [Burkholderiales bacterium]